MISMRPLNMNWFVRGENPNNAFWWPWTQSTEYYTYHYNPLIPLFRISEYRHLHEWAECWRKCSLLNASALVNWLGAYHSLLALESLNGCKKIVFCFFFRVKIKSVQTMRCRIERAEFSICFWIDTLTPLSLLTLNYKLCTFSFNLYWK